MARKSSSVNNRNTVGDDSLDIESIVDRSGPPTSGSPDSSESAAGKQRPAGTGRPAQCLLCEHSDPRCLPDRRLLGLVRLWRHGTAPLGRPDQHQRQHPGPDRRRADHRATGAQPVGRRRRRHLHLHHRRSRHQVHQQRQRRRGHVLQCLRHQPVERHRPHQLELVGGAATGNYSYFFQTYVHEIGHALGLGHQGPYNGSSTYGVDNIYTNDTWRWSAMSYHDQDDPALGDTFDYVLTPQMADICCRAVDLRRAIHADRQHHLRLQQQRGKLLRLRDATRARRRSPTTKGRHRYLDASGYRNNQTIDLTPGSWSSIGGEVNNIGIYLTTTIENAKGGTGDDTIPGNTAANSLTAMATIR